MLSTVACALRLRLDDALLGESSAREFMQMLDDLKRFPQKIHEREDAVAVTRLRKRFGLPAQAVNDKGR
jgi:hypothetical protein